MTIEERFEHITYIWNTYQAVHGLAPEWLRFERMTSQQLIGMAEQLKELHEHGYDPHPYYEEQ